MQTAIAFAGKRNAEGSPEDFFIGGHPLHTQVLSDGQNFFGNAAFGRPHPPRTDAEDLLVQIEAALKLRTSIFGMTKTILRQRESRSGYGAGVRITN